METTQAAGSCPAPSQAAVPPWTSSTTRDDTGTPGVAVSRFHGDGVRYQAKLIGVDLVPDSQGEKMCWDSMMKLKGMEIAARRQGKHKKRVWLKIFSNCLKYLDDRSWAVLYDHDLRRISSLTKDDTDPRALAYVYQNEDSYCLFYIKMANMADPVLADIREVCQRLGQEATQESAAAAAAAAAAPSPLLQLTDGAALTEESNLESVFSPRPDSAPAEAQQVSSSDELAQVFSVQMRAPLSPSQSSSSSQPENGPESAFPADRSYMPQPKLSSAQIISMFPTQPLGGSPYTTQPYPPTAAMPSPQGPPLGGHGMAPWPAMANSMAVWPPGGFIAPPAANGMINIQQGVQWGGVSPTDVNAAPPGGSVSQSPSLNSNLLL